MARNPTPSGKYQANSVALPVAKNLKATMAAATVQPQAPTEADLRARQAAIGGTRRTVAVPEVASTATRASAAAAERVSDEPESDVSE